jgi:oxygen-independent coproporphyrinogen III oxidase
VKPAASPAPPAGAPVRHLYLHIPFCHRICPYCSFYKHTPGRTDMAGFVAALLAETDHWRARLDLRPETVYFGGGTPTLLSPKHLGALLDGLHARLDLSGLHEWTVEANPRTFDRRKVALLRAAGVTRVSLGVQSWNPRFLELLGRDHQPA